MNERMTKRDTDGQAMMDCEKCKADWTGKHGKPMADCTALYCRNRLLDRLAAYEDTGLTPEEIKAPFTEDTMINLAAQALGVEPSRLRELAEADKDGRVVVLPCKVGDTVYTNNRVLGADNAMHDEICTRRIKGYGGNALNKVWLIVSGDYCDLSIFPSEFGKTVFFTREEAERAMAEMKSVEVRHGG